ncbi:unnamed protein product [Ceutorhynchus assimilis]|uniref:Uncharacterized protein n=1 Tax=Ceutorhynchus assimilis TaxID=467358 RepID=A0A9N9QRF0_9CUCU|nr:unnamed protein product [Ceutorhynchus assimilis]
MVNQKGNHQNLRHQSHYHLQHQGVPRKQNSSSSNQLVDKTIEQPTTRMQWFDYIIFHSSHNSFTNNKLAMFWIILALVNLNFIDNAYGEHTLKALGQFNSSDRDYTPELNFLTIEYVEKSLVGTDFHFNFKKVNRTQFTLNAEFDLLQDLDGNKMEIVSELYALVHHHYKFMGLRLENNACQMWKTNYCMMKSILKKYTNIDACNITKKRYYVKDFVFDSSFFPKSVPLGSFKALITAKADGKKILEIAYFLRMNYYAGWQKDASNRLNIRVL